MSLFGKDLSAQLSDQRLRFGVSADCVASGVPYVLHAADAVIRTSLGAPGLFRQDVELKELETLKRYVETAYADRRQLDFRGATSSSVIAAACVLKVYLKSLPAPLLTTELYPYFLSCGDPGGNDMLKLGQLADLLARLPPGNFAR